MSKTMITPDDYEVGGEIDEKLMLFLHETDRSKEPATRKPYRRERSLRKYYERLYSESRVEANDLDEKLNRAYDGISNLVEERGELKSVISTLNKKVTFLHASYRQIIGTIKEARCIPASQLVS